MIGFKRYYQMKNLWTGVIGQYRKLSLMIKNVIFHLFPAAEVRLSNLNFSEENTLKMISNKLDLALHRFVIFVLFCKTYPCL